jgi:hypothetical protein
LRAYVEDDRSPAAIVDMGFDAATVQRVMAMVERAEYKRRQAPPGIKITERAFGRDRRLPITNGYTSSATPPSAPDAPANTDAQVRASANGGRHVRRGG